LRAIKLLFTSAIALIVLLTGIVLTIHNTTPVIIDLVWVKLPEASLSIWLIISMVVGLLVGILLTSARVLTLRAKLLNSARKLRNAEQQIETLNREVQRGAE
jgi:putative membrane protein